MGASKSKSSILSEIRAARAAESIARAKLGEQESQCRELTLLLEEQQHEYQAKYLELEMQHSSLQERFLELKSKFETDEQSSGDFTNRANELNQKLSKAFNERDCIKMEYQKQLDSVVSSQNSVENEIPAGVRNKLNLVEASYREKIQRLEMDQQELFNEKLELRNKFEADKHKLQEDNIRNGVLLRARCEEEKSQLNQQWELKLDEVMQNCSEEVSKFRTTLVQENCTLQEKLNTALRDIEVLNRKYKLLNNLFEEIRTRYERRESRKEDLERIANLEGQLIIQSEDMERQKEILKSLKFTTQQNCNTKRRNRKNGRKSEKLNNVQNENFKLPVNQTRINKN